MARLRLVKHYSLAHLGTEWKDAYLNFHSFTAEDIKNNVTIDTKTASADEISASFSDMLGLLEKKFIDGKLPNEDGTLSEVTKEEIATLDIDIIQGAISFLSQSQQPIS